jgi:hypothetical protein
MNHFTLVNFYFSDVTKTSASVQKLKNLENIHTFFKTQFYCNDNSQGNDKK